MSSEHVSDDAARAVALEDELQRAQFFLSRALARNNPVGAVATLEAVGRAALGAGPKVPLTIPAPLASELAAHASFIAGAAFVLGELGTTDGPDAFTRLLYARSGYQALVDAGIWGEPPLRADLQAEADEDLEEVLAGQTTVERPAWVPRSHSWWP